MVQLSWLCVPLLFELNGIFSVDVTTAAVIHGNGFVPNTTPDLPTATVVGITDINEHKSVDFDQITAEPAPHSLEEVKTSDLNIPESKGFKEETTSDRDKVDYNLQSRISKDQGNLKTLMEFERYVISKKYPYAELDGVQSKHLSLESNTAEGENQHRSHPHFFGDQSISQISDDALQNIEIVSRGLTGFEIPSFRHESKNESSVNSGEPDDKDSHYKELIDESIVDQLKRLINEYEEKKRRMRMPFCEMKKPVN